MVASLLLVVSLTASGPACVGWTATTITGTLNPLDLTGQQINVSFDEIPATTTPFTIEGAAFSGPGVILSLPSELINSPSGSPVLSSQSTPADLIRIDFDEPVKGVGAYLNVAGASTAADLHLELYSGIDLLADLDLSDFTAQTMTFFGASADATVITHAVFRNVAVNRVSFIMDDLIFVVPEPASAAMIASLAAAGLGLLRRR
jgi:hypothetical protein